MSRRLSKVLSIMVCICFVFSFYISNTFAAAKNFEVFDKNNIEVIQNDANLIKVVAEYNGDYVYATLDKATKQVTMQAIETPRLIGVDIPIGPKKITNYTVNIENADKENVTATIIDTDNKKEHKIRKTNTEKVIAQAPLAIPLIEIVGGWLIQQLIALFFAVVIAGVTYVAASEIAQTLRNKRLYNYYQATLSGGEVYIGNAYPSDSAAFSAVRARYNVFAISYSKSNEAARKGGNGTATHHYAHGSGDGYWNHWHPNISTGVLGKQHCWY